MSPGAPGRAGLLCILPGECRELVVTTSGLDQGGYSLRLLAWESVVGVRFGEVEVTLGPEESTTRTGYFASTSIREVEVEVYDSAGELVATSGRIPW